MAYEAREALAAVSWSGHCPSSATTAGDSLGEQVNALRNRFWNMGGTGLGLRVQRREECAETSLLSPRPLSSYHDRTRPGLPCHRRGAGHARPDLW